MKKMMMILAVLFAMVGSSFGDNYEKTSTVKWIQTYRGGQIDVVLDEMPDGVAVFRFTKDDEMTNIWVSMLLSAYHNKTNVYLRGNDTEVGGTPSTPILTKLEVKP